MIGADQTQIVRSSALHEAQIACVIDDSGKIRVFVIYAHGLMVPTVANFPIKSVHNNYLQTGRNGINRRGRQIQPLIGVSAPAATRGRASVARIADREARVDQSRRTDRSPPPA